ncbi:MAG: Distinct helicase family with a unique C-terminal domain including a metal-binding cluster [Candidatus Methanohalarchaeum thermophilum]|uniref:Distinct helicase family with a unique C-terminal domain including a metal-binding cluster n=1 Tax=Methanohalarchaeum thermophilum TaxID=1903181 RepID=A0A1Q6DWI6_METT1|nr:MAG: Distinct helicase family with a unique C-terminal domain including a metal-binding cluster [Candidatus Methanohalarchaeum thermophilum]
MNKVQQTDKIMDAIEGVRGSGWYREQIEEIRELPGEEPEFEEVELKDEIREYLDRNGIDLYTHQARCIEEVRGGKDVVLSTPTASGKTLAFNIPVFEDLIEDKDARALYIYPTKALSNDQLESIKEMDDELGLDVDPGVYDGDTSRGAKRKIRESSRVILTNPYGLHHYLPWHNKWKNVFKNLEYIVLDEVHQYRGVFGSNIAFLVRRLKRVVEHYGGSPQFILSSATIANPGEFSKKLVGRDFEVVSRDGSGSGKKYFVFWNPLEYEDQSIHVQTSNLLSYMVDGGLQTLCFTVSRKMAELISKWSDESSDKKIMAYRAGYKPRERRIIEQGLREGEVRGVASTNALEVGVDIGGLDVVLMSGYPGTMISTWQQAGRAGRGNDASAAFLIAFENPLDQYYMNHPDRFFEKSHEHAIIDLDNSNIAIGHLLCAASELPLKENEWLTQNNQEELNHLKNEDILHETPNGVVYGGEKRPAEIVELNNISQDIIKIILNGKLLGTMDRAQAYREAHENAVYMHQGETYVVQELDLDDKVAYVKKREVDYYTEPQSQTDIKINEKQETKTHKNLKINLGNVEVSEFYLKYKIMENDKVIATEPLDLPPINFKTESTWITIPKETIRELEEKDMDIEGGLHAIEHAMIAMAPYHAMCDRWDLGGVSTKNHTDTQKPTIFLYDAYEGGIGITEKCYQLINELLQTTYELIKDCDCENGCPSCIYSPKCGNDNEPLDKQTALTILKKLTKNQNKKTT